MVLGIFAVASSCTHSFICKGSNNSIVEHTLTVQLLYGFTCKSVKVKISEAKAALPVSMNVIGSQLEP